MKDWAIKYVMHVLETKEWSANRLAKEAGVATSTIARPLREKDYSGKLSRDTISKVQAASGIDPGPFAPENLQEDPAIFSHARPSTQARRTLEALDSAGGDTAPSGVTAQRTNEIKIAIVGHLAQIVATVDVEGIQSLRRKLDQIESIISED